VLGESGRLPPAGVVRVAAELVLDHRFDADRLARSYLEIVRRGSAKGSLGPALRAAADAMAIPGPLGAINEVRAMCDRLEALLPQANGAPPPPFDPLPDYLSLIYDHNLRKKHTLPDAAHVTSTCYPPCRSSTALVCLPRGRAARAPREGPEGPRRAQEGRGGSESLKRPRGQEGLGKAREAPGRPGQGAGSPGKA
jgi:hypothetical protein